jgi:hypothetical protein
LKNLAYGYFFSTLMCGAISLFVIGYLRSGPLALSRLSAGNLREGMESLWLAQAFFVFLQIFIALLWGHYRAKGNWSEPAADAHRNFMPNHPEASTFVL